MKRKRRSKPPIKTIEVPNLDGTVTVYNTETNERVDTHTKTKFQRYMFNEDNAGYMLINLSEGLSVRQACKRLGIPVHVHHLWRKKYPEYDAAVIKAMEFRADDIHERFTEIDIIPLSDTPADYLEPDTLEKIAAKQKILDNYRKSHMASQRPTKTNPTETPSHTGVVNFTLSLPQEVIDNSKRKFTPLINSEEEIVLPDPPTLPCGQETTDRPTINERMKTHDKLPEGGNHA